MLRLFLGISLVTLASATSVVPEYFTSGFTHVLPDGLDHILFILGLFFLSRSFPVLLFQMTLFTVAHSLALGLSLYGFISVPSKIVEIAIALSISFIAIENLIVKDHLRAWRPWVIIAFGLVHGLGFAHSFAEKPISKDNFLPALFSFNLGIEFGQIAVIGIAYAAVALWWKRGWYANVIARPACVAIAMIGFYMAARRIG
jgi:hypothetical protein